MSRPHVAVIGAGWAGLSAACRLAAGGASVTLFEATRQLGGRARRVDWKTSELGSVALDNGQHILLGGYRHTLALMRLAGVDESEVLQREPVRFRGSDGFALTAWPLPAPWHLLGALLGARGLTWRSRWDMVRLMKRARASDWRLGQDQTVAAWLSQEDQSLEITEKLWRPLCVAALNTPVDIASAQVFLNVLRDSLGGRREASDLLLPKAPLDELLPNACERFLLDHGTRIRLATRVVRVDLSGAGVGLEDASGATTTADGAILAVPAHQVAALLDAKEAPHLLPLLAQCATLSWQPITTVYLAYPASVRLPVSMLALTESLEHQQFGQWVFDKSQLGGPAGLLAVVISAQGPHQELAREAIGLSVQAQIEMQLGILQAPRAIRVISEKRATFACVPGLMRPCQQTPDKRLALAGDYTHSDYPATLETAVESGWRAAQLFGS